MTHLVLGYPGPVAARLLRQDGQRGARAIVVAPVRPALPSGEGLEWVEGEPTSIDFGLSGPAYSELLARVRRVTLAETGERSILDVEESRLVRQAAEVAEFVAAGGAPEGVVFLSSLLVFGNAQGPVTEDDFDVGQRFETRNEEAMAVAEKIIRTTSPRASLAIVRTAPVAGDEESGTLFEHSALARLARELRGTTNDFGYTFRDLPAWFETVDGAARALAAVACRLGTQTYHLAHAKGLTDRGLVRWLAQRWQRTLSEAAPGSVWSSRSRSTAADERAVRGWSLQFTRHHGERVFSDLLHRDPYRMLEALFPALDTALPHA